ncbi:18880_t:CDS:2, partial [Gigaspora margarita]
KKRLERILRSPDSTPNELWDAFSDYLTSTKEYYQRRFRRKEISEQEFNKQNQILNSLDFRIKQMINQIKRLENKNNILEKKNKKLRTENEKLQIENENLQNVIIDVATKFNNSEERNSQQRQIIQDIATVLCQDEELNLNTLNEILQNNGIKEIIIERDRYSSFNSAANASEPKIYEIVDDNPPPLQYTYSFCQIDNETDEPNEFDENNYINTEEFNTEEF